jgi:Cu/Ag efflux protein CusF
MSRTLSKAVVLAIAVVLAAAPFVFAQTSGTSPGTGSTSSSSTTTHSSQTSTMGAQDTLNATVADVNHQHNTVKLKMQGGETIEFKVPEASLTNLNKGDSVQVSIRKAEAQPGMGGMAPSRPESTRPESTTPGGSSGTRSR